MRDLTEEELKLAPDWATHYDTDFMFAYPVKVTFIDESNAVDLFQSDKLGDVYFNDLGIRGEDRLIIRSFDITKHEFSDSDLSVLKSDGGTLWVDIEHGNLGNRDNASAIMIKQDVIAIAKALGVTGEDLK